jgi:putative inorganic carbon (HCO3(-)) transporter
MQHFNALSDRLVSSSRATIAQQLILTVRQAITPRIFVFGSVAVGLGVLTVASLASKNPMLFLAAALFPFVALIIGHFRELLLAIIILDVPLRLDIHLGYREEMASMGALGGFNISATTVCLGLLYLLWFSEFACKQGPRFLPKIRESLPVIAYIASLVPSLFFATEVELAVSQIWLLLQMLFLFIYVSSTVRCRKDLVFLVTLLLASLIIESTLMMYVRISGEEFTLGPISTQIDASYLGTGRFGGTLGSPNTAGGYLTMLTLVAVSVFFTRLGRFHKLLAALAFSSGILGLVLTASRGGWASFAIALPVLWFLAWRKGCFSLQRSFAIVILTVLLSAPFHDTIRTRLVSDDRGAAYSRVPLMDLAFRVIKENPVFGVGPNNFAFVMDHYLTPEFRNAWIYTVHNKYLLIWAETGIASLLAFLWFVAATLRAAWHCSRSRDLVVAPLGFGLAAAVLAHSAHMFVDVFNDRPLIQLLFFIGGLTAAIYGLERRTSARVH